VPDIYSWTTRSIFQAYLPHHRVKYIAQAEDQALQPTSSLISTLIGLAETICMLGGFLLQPPEFAPKNQTMLTIFYQEIIPNNFRVWVPALGRACTRAWTTLLLRSALLLASK
jgi:hypothetical protein